MGVVALAIGGCGDDSNATPGTGATGTVSTGGSVEVTTTGAPSGSSGQVEGSSTTSGSSSRADPDGTSSSSSSGGDPEFWQPEPGISWQWQLVGTVDTSIDVAVYDIDLFDVPQETIDALHADGRVVICYFSAGSYEQWREDADQFPAAAIGDPLDGWPGEAWLDHRDPTIRTIMQARLDLAVTKDCDAVEPDNVDGYTNPTGFDLGAADQLDYNRFLAAEAHARGLSIGLKNDVDQVAELVDDFDWALNEECVSYRECGTKSPFIQQGKAVFHVEYVDDPAEGPGLAEQVCPQTTGLGFSTLIKEWDLTPWRLACD